MQLKKWDDICKINNFVKHKYQERKQVGIVYHFTNNQIYKILKSNSLIGTLSSGMKNKMISLTRNYDLRDMTKVHWGTVRITLDGNKLSDRYTIVPFHDLLNLDDPEVKKVAPYYRESEEAVIADEIKILSRYILRIDFLKVKQTNLYISAIKPFLDTTDNPNLFYLKGTKIPVVIVDKFLPYHREQLPESVKYHKVVRKGKTIRQAYTDKTGYKMLTPYKRIYEEVSRETLKDMRYFGLGKNSIRNGYVTLYHGGVKLPVRLKKDEILFMTPDIEEAQNYADIAKGKVFTLKVNPEDVHWNQGSREVEFTKGGIIKNGVIIPNKEKIPKEKDYDYKLVLNKVKNIDEYNGYVIGDSVSFGNGFFIIKEIYIDDIDQIHFVVSEKNKIKDYKFITLVKVGLSEYKKITEGVKWKKVVRNGKSIRKAYTDRDGYKIVYKNGKPTEVKMSSKERTKRKKATKRSGKKPTKSSEINKRKKSMKKRTWESVEFQESLFNLNPKKLFNILNQLKRKYDRYYKIINDLKMIGNKLKFSILYWNNRIGVHEFELEDTGLFPIKSEDSYLDFDKDGFISFKEFLNAIKQICDFNYTKIYKNSNNDLRARDYGKYIMVK